jgi:translation elongation factor EF-Tu-like GTPase
MGLFRRRDVDLQPQQPFTFVVEDVFTITTVGHVLTGRVTSGVMTKGQAADLRLPGGARSVTIARIESRRRKQEQVAAGAEAGVVLDGLGPDDIPTKPGGEHRVLDSDGLRGVQLVGH